MDYLLIISKTHQPLPKEMLSYRGERINWQKDLPQTYQDVFAWASQDGSRVCHIYDFQPIRQRVFEEDDTLYLLHGIAFDAQEQLVFSAEKASSFLPEKNYTGIYSHAKIKDYGECFISADQLGFSPLYYAESEDLIFAGNEPFLIAHYLYQLGCEIAPEPSLPVWLIDGIDIESDHSGFRHIRRVRPLEYLYITTENTLAFCPKALEEYGTDYESTLERLRQQSVQRIHSLKENYTLTGHLTGGFDTRVVFSLFLSAGVEKEIAFSTNGVNGNPDVEIARMLAQHYELNWTQSIPSITENGEDPSTAVARQNRINNLVCAGERGFVNPCTWNYVPDPTFSDKPVILFTGSSGEYTNIEHYDRFKDLMKKQFKCPIVDDTLTWEQLEFAGDAIGYNTTYRLLNAKGKAVYAQHRKEMAAHLIAHFENLCTAINGFEIYRSKNHYGGQGLKDSGYSALLYQPTLIHVGNMVTNEERKAQKVFFDLDRMADRRLPMFPMEHRVWHPLCYKDLPEEEQKVYRHIEPMQFPDEDKDFSKGLYTGSLQAQEKLHAAMLQQYEASILLIKKHIPKDLPQELLEYVDVGAIQELVDSLTVDSWGRDARSLINLLGVADWCDCLREFFPKGQASVWPIAQVPDISHTDKIACDGRWYKKAIAKLLNREKTIRTQEGSLEQKIYIGEVPIQYVFRKATQSKDSHLVVVFSAFSSLGSKYPHSYNYLNAMSQMPGVNQLFILDSFGPRGCYYIGKEMNHKVEQSVVELIKHICNENKIPWENVILSGSSKGGSAALYFGLRYHPGCVVAGAPQFYIADYAKEWAPETFEYLTGNDPQKVQELNGLIQQQINGPVPVSLNILTSRNDWQYFSHIIPLHEAFITAGVQADIEVEDHIKNHGDIANHYPMFLHRCILKAVYNYVLHSIRCSLAKRCFTLHIDSTPTDNSIFTWRVTLKNGASTVTGAEITSGKWQYELPTKGDYIAELELIREGNVIYRYQTETMQTETSFMKQYPFFHTVRQSAVVQGSVLNNGQLVDLARGGTMFLKTKTAQAKDGRFLFSSFLEESTHLDLLEQTQFYNLSVVHNFLSSTYVKQQDSRFNDVCRYVEDMIASPPKTIEAMHTVHDSAYDRIYTLIWYAEVMREYKEQSTADQIDKYLKKTELPYLRSIKYAEMGNWGRLRALSARLMLELYFDETKRLDEISTDVVELIHEKFVGIMDPYRNLATTSSLLRYIHQISNALKCVGCENEEICSFVSAAEKTLSALTLPGAKRYILPAMDNADEVSTLSTPRSEIINADIGMSVFRTDEIMFALRASGGDFLSHHADNGSLLLAVNGNQVFINAGREEQNADGHSGVWYSSMSDLTPGLALKETTSSVCQITGDENSFEAELNSTFAMHGPLHRRICYAQRELTITDEFEGKQETANIQFLLHPDCINVSQSGNRITWYHHGIAMMFQVGGGRQTKITLGRVTQKSRTLCAIHIETLSPCRVVSCLKMDFGSMEEYERLRDAYVEMDPPPKQFVDLLNLSICDQLVELESMGATELYRIGRKAYLEGDKALSRKCEYLNKLLHNCHIKSTCHIGRGTRIAYGGMGVLIHADSKVGQYCNIGTGVTLASAPTIGDYCYIATGAKIIGAYVNIGSFSIIGANAVVRKNVEPFTIVGGVPARVLGHITPENLEKYLKSFLASTNKNDEAFVEKVRREFLAQYKKQEILEKCVQS